MESASYPVAWRKINGGDHVIARFAVGSVLDLSCGLGYSSEDGASYLAGTAPIFANQHRATACDPLNLQRVGRLAGGGLRRSRLRRPARSVEVPHRRGILSACAQEDHHLSHELPEGAAASSHARVADLVQDVPPRVVVAAWNVPRHSHCYKKFLTPVFEACRGWPIGTDGRASCGQDAGLELQEVHPVLFPGSTGTWSCLGIT